MGLSRKRKKELKRLRSSAEDLWNQQHALIDQANSVAREAKRQAGHLTHEHLAPAMRDGYESYVRPGLEATGRAAGGARDRLVGDVIPAVGTIVGTALTVVDHARDARAKTFARQLNPQRLSKAVSQRTLAAERAIGRKDGSPGAGTYVALGLGIAAAVGVVYAVWQTFRADDELWVSDDPAPAPASDSEGESGSEADEA